LPSTCSLTIEYNIKYNLLRTNYSCITIDERKQTISVKQVHVACFCRRQWDM